MVNGNIVEPEVGKGMFDGTQPGLNAISFLNFTFLILKKYFLILKIFFYI